MVSAIPENLIKYSAVCTGAAQEVQNWVSAVLRPALLAYQNAGHPCVGLDAEVAVAVSRAYYTDRDVAAVARAFQHSQHASVDGRGVVTARESDVDAAYRLLQARNQARMKAGAALAARLTPLIDEGDGGNPDAARPIVDELAAHADDPYFCAGFFNALTDQPHLSTVLALGGIPALVSAFSSGAVSPRATALVAARISLPAGAGGPEGPTSPLYRMSGGQKGQLLDALAASPSASYQLAKALTPHEVQEMFYGDRRYSAKVMSVLTAGMRGEHAPQAARDLMHKVSQGLFGQGAPTLTNSEWERLVKPVSDFYAHGMLNSVAPPTDFSEEDLRDWAHVTGTHNGEDIAPFLHALNSSDPNNELIKSMIQGGYVSAGTVLLVSGPEGAAAGIAFDAAIGALQSAYSSGDPGMGWLDRAFPPGDNPNAHAANEKMALGGLTQSLALLGAMGQIQHAKTGEKVHFTGDRAHDKKLMDHILTYPEGYTAGSGRFAVQSLIDAHTGHELHESSKGMVNGPFQPSYG